MADLPNDWFMMVPLRDLEALTMAARELPVIKEELSKCYKQLDLCRSIQIELMDKYKELERML